MVELRKRKAHVQDPSSSPPLKKRNSLPIAVDPEKNVAPEAGDSSFVELVPGDIIDIIGFGGDISIHTGEKTTLKSLLESSQNGVILFTYPKASTPGCTTQACLFRDDYSSLTMTGYSIYGLSRDSPKANALFKTRQGLPYTLLSDPHATLIEAICMRNGLKRTKRGVFVINKQAIVEGPAATVNKVRDFLHEVTCRGATVDDPEFNKKEESLNTNSENIV